MPQILTEDILLRQTRQSTRHEENRMRLLGPEKEEDTPGTKTLLTPQPARVILATRLFI
jgi:hypothetical protein